MRRRGERLGRVLVPASVLIVRTRIETRQGVEIPRNGRTRRSGERRML